MAIIDVFPFKFLLCLIGRSAFEYRVLNFRRLLESAGDISLFFSERNCRSQVNTWVNTCVGDRLTPPTNTRTFLYSATLSEP